ncbi:MAG: hypothetical protein AB1846_12570 [Chloroflexota bacterium]
MKPKNAAMAGFLNVVFPGLGCVYLGKWFLALVYLIWVPLAWIAVIAVAKFITGRISDETARSVLYLMILFGFRVRILWDVFFTPYSLAEEYNQKSVSQRPLP